MGNQKQNKYIITEEDGYVKCVNATLDDKYDFYGQMANYPEATEGWMKFIRDETPAGGTFIVDEKKKDEIIAKRKAQEKEEEKKANWLTAQMLFTATMTDTLLEDE